MREGIPGRQHRSGFVACVSALAVLPILVWPAVVLPLAAAPPLPAQQPTNTTALQVSVVDENGAAVPSSAITLTPAQGAPLLGETDYAGRKQFANLVAGDYTVHVEKEGFFAVTHAGIHVGEVDSAEITLNHVREFTEQVNVVYSPPAIDPAKTQASETLDSQAIVNLPFHVERDIRYALPLLPGVLQDPTGQLHVSGSSTRQVNDQIDGFNVSDPASGMFLTRISVDAVRSTDVESSRYSTEYGKGSGGVISLRTVTGDDHWRLTGTDPIPGIQDRKGLTISTWTPRVMVSGPLRKGRAWFTDALEGEYDLRIFTELPLGADRTKTWRISNLSKAQVNLAQNNNLTVGLLLNFLDSPHSGLDPLDPISTTQRYSANSYMFTAKDQYLFENGLLFEAGVATSNYYTNVSPQGGQTYIETPNGTLGNYYLTNHARGGRTEVIGNLFVPPVQRAGRHEFKLGVDFDRLDDHQEYIREPYLIERTDGTISRRVTFTNSPPFTRHDSENSGYAQDRWTFAQRWLVEPGLRFDSDSTLHGIAASPRLASTVMLKHNGNSKISWGIGVYRDPSNLSLLTTSLTGTRIDYFYDSTGINLRLPPVPSTFTINANQLRFSFVTNSSVAFEQKLPHTTYLRIELMDRRARNVWTFENPGGSYSPSGPFSGDFILTNGRRDHYDSAELTVRHIFKHNHVVFASYTRSRALTNADFGYNLDNVLFSPQSGGPLPWDTPNRFLSWGWLPFTHQFDLAYTLDWRSGFPFTVQNDSQEIVGAPGSRRFPPYFSLDLSLERRFRLLGYQWALRAGLDNVTDRGNYSYVNSNINSPQFLTFSGAQGHSFVARIRFLGRK